MRRLAIIAASCCLCALTCASVARAQSATVTVAPIPPTVAGNSIALAWTVTNTGSTARTFGVGAEIRYREAILSDLGGQTTPTIMPGATASGAFTRAIPTWWSGGHVARAAVWTGPAGSSTWLDAFDRDFTVTPYPLSIVGRVAYHSYSDYLAPPADTDDGHVFLWTLPGGPLRKVTDGQPVENAVNPHLSPDGSRVAFTAIPSGVVPPATPRDYASLAPYLEIFAYDLARDSLVRLTSNHVPDEDGKFSPDGRIIVFKRAGEIWLMSADGGDAVRLTPAGGSRSGPSYSPDGASIVYWDSDGAQADLWRMPSSGGAPTLLVGVGGIQEYYPIYRNAQTLLYSRWEAPSDRHDKVYSCSLVSGATQRLPMNLSGVEDADAFPVNDELIGFSSTRRGGSYDLYVGSPSTGATYAVGVSSDALHELAGCYSPYAHARALSMVSPGTDVQLPSAGTLVAKVRAYSDGSAWSGASPRMVLEGPTVVEFALHDDGSGGDQAADDGIYSTVATLPSQPGTYQMYASAVSSDNGLTQELRSSSVAVTLTEPTAVAQTGTERPPQFQLGQGFPNPFHLSTSIEFSIPRPTFTSLQVFDARGGPVVSLVDRELPAGRYRVSWDGSRLPSGTYFYRLRAGAFTDARKVVLIK